MRVAGDHENRIVAGYRSYDIGQLRSIDGDGGRVRLAGPCPEDHQLLDTGKNSVTARLSVEAAVDGGGAAAAWR